MTTREELQKVRSGFKSAIHFMMNCGARLADDYPEVCEAESLLDGMIQRAGWQPIATAPQPERNYLIFMPKYGVHTAYYGPPNDVGITNMWIAGDGTRLSEYDVTHWQPLPAPPTNTAGEREG